MAVCNLFKPIKNKIGNFLLFSQYTNDLTKSATHTDPYRVIPSKFVVMDINYSKWTDEKIVKLLQNNFENACALMKNNGVIYKQEISGEELKSHPWDPAISRNLFWRCLFDNDILHTSKVSVGDEKYDICTEMKFVGDINIQSNNIYNGEGYNEIYCYIPPSKNCNYIGCDVKPIDDTDYIYSYNEDYVIGYDEKSNLDDIVKIPPEDKPLKYNANNKANFSFEGGLNSDPNPVTKYEFNTIVVLYDVYVMNENATEWVLETGNIPMGIHFCGHIDGGKMSNPITVFVSNDDVYGAGTSYGLKICMRYTATSTDNISNINISSESNTEGSDSMIPGESILVSEMAKTLDKMNSIITSVYKNSQMSKECLALFKNSRTNVPYVKWVGSDPYWFVNGRNTGALATRVADHINYTEQEMNEGLDRFERELSGERIEKIIKR